MHSYEMNHNPFPSSARGFPEKQAPTVYGELTRENLKRFEKEQERSALERKMKQKVIQSREPTPTVTGEHQPQQYILDRVVDVDVVKEEDKYLCCCRCTHVYRGAWFVGLMQAIICLVAAIVVIVNYSRLGLNYLNHFVAVVCICVCYIIVLAFHFCGLQGKTACMLIPNLLAQFITMILLIVASILISLILTASDQSALVIWAGWGPLYGDLAKEAGLSLLTVGLVLIGACGLAIVVWIWFFYITLRCYRYLSDQKRKRHGLVYNQSGKSAFSVTNPVPSQCHLEERCYAIAEYGELFAFSSRLHFYQQQSACISEVFTSFCAYF